MSDKQKEFSDVQVEIPIQDEPKLLEVPIEAHRTLLLIYPKDHELYNNMNQWVTNNQDKTLKDTISEFDPFEYQTSDALAKVIHGYPLPYLPDFIIRYKNHDEDRQKLRQKNFEILLLRNGLILEREIDVDGLYTYVKIIAPFCMLYEEARQTRLKMEKIKNKNKSDSRNNAEIALNFFNNSRKILLAHRLIITANLLNRKIWDDEGKPLIVKRNVKSLAIDFLLSEGVFDKFYPLHDGSPKIKGSKDSPEEFEKSNLRAQLSALWVRSSKNQPLDKIRTYFGEKLALYYAWMGFYTSWLSVASITGVIVVIYGLIDWSSKRKLGTNDNDGGISVIWDNALTAPYAFLMSVWAICFPEIWKRVNISIQYDWDVINYEKQELPRPEFYGTVLRMSRITLRQEIHFPSKEKRKKLIISGMIVLISIGIVIVIVGFLIQFPRKYFQHLGYVALVVTSLVNLVTIIILNLIYTNVARSLTHFENHKTETQFEDSLILKTYLFDFVNFYSVLIYFVLAGNQAGKGMIQITIQFIIIFIGRQVIRQCQEIFIPWLLVKWNKAKLILERDCLEKKYAESGRKCTKVPQWVLDDLLTSPKDAEYKEMVVQFGFLVLFGIAFPLAPLFAWINNLFEIKASAFKYIEMLQRPVGFLAQDLGMWERIMMLVSLMAALTNSTIIAFHSLWMERQFKTLTNYDENDKNSEGRLLAARIGFILAFEHLVLIIKFIFTYFVPNVPKKVEMSMKKEKYFTKLVSGEEELTLDEYLGSDASLFSERGYLLLPKTGSAAKAKFKTQ